MELGTSEENQLRRQQYELRNKIALCFKEYIESLNRLTNSLHSASGFLEISLLLRKQVRSLEVQLAHLKLFLVESVQVARRLDTDFAKGNMNEDMAIESVILRDETKLLELIKQLAKTYNQVYISICFKEGLPGVLHDSPSMRQAIVSTNELRNLLNEVFKLSLSEELKAREGSSIQRVFLSYGYQASDVPVIFSTEGIGNCTGVAAYNKETGFSLFAHMAIFTASQSDLNVTNPYLFQVMELLKNHNPNNLKLLLTGMTYIKVNPLGKKRTEIPRMQELFNKRVQMQRNRIIKYFLSLGIPQANIIIAFPLKIETTTNMVFNTYTRIVELDYMNMANKKITMQAIQL
jgi:hypothetical protein